MNNRGQIIQLSPGIESCLANLNHFVFFCVTTRLRDPVTATFLVPVVCFHSVTSKWSGCHGEMEIKNITRTGGCCLARSVLERCCLCSFYGKSKSQILQFNDGKG